MNLKLAVYILACKINLWKFIQIFYKIKFIRNLLKKIYFKQKSIVKIMKIHFNLKISRNLEK